ncbi:Cardiolipin synthetase [hydrothermal vent metagenome]|uniref:Cardiolipin synthetase n=1 Tax=hydrothermal vent metagenome TaxID=652676 RepID=A0A3B0UTQ5_9ZZZZ
MEWVQLHIKEYLVPVIIIVYYSWVVFAVIKILLENKNPLKTHSYLLLLILLPIAGLLIYLFFGQDYRRHKFFSRKKAMDSTIVDSIVNGQLNLAFQHELIGDGKVKAKLNIINLLLRNNNAFLTTNNRVEMLINGEKKFDSLLKDIDKAVNHIHLEYYIFEEDKIGNEIIGKLIQKASEGVIIRFIYDDVGSKISFLTKKKLKEARIQAKPIMPVYFPKFSKANYRDHRKIIVIDGKIGYVGGINVADRYINKEGKKYWRDTHLKIEGNAVHSLQIAFLLNWYYAVKEKLDFTKGLFPNIISKGSQCVQIAGSGPDTDWASIMQAFFVAITSASKRVWITSPYFIPNEPVLTAIKTASLSGIDVQIIFPHQPDSYIVHAASMSYMKEMLEAGVKVHLYTKGFIHAKTLLVDDVFSSVGTANMDYRSFDQNYEINAMVYSVTFAKQLENQFLEDVAQCVPLQLNRWEQRPIRTKLLESIARLLAPLL